MDDGGGGKTRPADDIADRIDVRRRGLVELVHGDVAMLIQADAGIFDGKPAGVCLAAQGEKEAFRREHPAVGQGQYRPVAAPLNAEVPAVVDVIDVATGEVVLQLACDLVIEELQQPIAAVKQGDLHSQGGENGGVFGADHSAAKDDHGLRNPADTENRSRVDDGLVVEGHVRRIARMGAGGDDNPLALHPCFLAALDSLDCDRMAVDETCRPADDVDAVPFELAGDDRLFLAPHAV